MHLQADALEDLGPRTLVASSSSSSSSFSSLEAVLHQELRRQCYHLPSHPFSLRIHHHLPCRIPYHRPFLVLRQGLGFGFHRFQFRLSHQIFGFNGCNWQECLASYYQLTCYQSFLVVLAFSFGSRSLPEFFFLLRRTQMVSSSQFHSSILRDY